MTLNDLGWPFYVNFCFLAGLYNQYAGAIQVVLRLPIVAFSFRDEIRENK